MEWVVVTDEALVVIGIGNTRQLNRWFLSREGI